MARRGPLRAWIPAQRASWAWGHTASRAQSGRPAAPGGGAVGRSTACTAAAAGRRQVRACGQGRRPCLRCTAMGRTQDWNERLRLAPPGGRTYPSTRAGRGRAVRQDRWALRHRLCQVHPAGRRRAKGRPWPCARAGGRGRHRLRCRGRGQFALTPRWAPRRRQRHAGHCARKRAPRGDEEPLAYRAGPRPPELRTDHDLPLVLGPGRVSRRRGPSPRAEGLRPWARSLAVAGGLAAAGQVPGLFHLLALCWLLVWSYDGERVLPLLSCGRRTGLVAVGGNE